MSLELVEHQVKRNHCVVSSGLPLDAGIMSGREDREDEILSREFRDGRVGYEVYADVVWGKGTSAKMTEIVIDYFLGLETFDCGYLKTSRDH